MERLKTIMPPIVGNRYPNCRTSALAASPWPRYR